MRLELLAKSAGIMLLIASTTASAQAPIAAPPNSSAITPRQNEILAKVMSPTGGMLTKELHTEFWQPVYQIAAPSAADLATIKTVVDLSLTYQREIWASALASARAHREVLSPGYAVARQAALQPPTGVLRQATQLQAAVENGDRVIRAAATGAAINTRGQSVHVTEQMASRVLEGLEGVVARAQRLFTLEWSETMPRSEFFADMKIAVSSDVPFTKGEETIQIGNASVRMIQLSRGINEFERVTISTATLPAPYRVAELEDSLRRVVSNAFESIGASQVGASIVSNFSGATSVTATGKISIGGKTFWMAFRSVYRETHTQVLEILTISDARSKAVALRERQENDIRLLD
ncbi:hypothetical protein AB4Z40_34435 [Bosea sp. 2YAB26]|uniref:hypothetical protein n=1 Tax=Bosea sp. 2YAB26 TaxID=3237478 RepID=UPI003F909203